MHAKQCAEKDGDNRQVGPTGREGLEPPLSRAHVQNGDEDEDVDEDDGEKTDKIGSRHHKHGSFFNIGVRARTMRGGSAQ
jgi:hypothetical protein